MSQINLGQSQSELRELFESELALAIPSEYQNNKKARLLREHAVNYLQEIYGECQIHDTSVPYVAMTIFDRVISKDQSLIQNKEIDLLVISCFVISCKKKIELFRARTFLLENRMNYSLGEVVLMERRILKSLEWITDPNPFCFVKCFLPLLPPSQIIRRPHVFQIIVWSQADIRFTQFRPSTLAAAAILCVFPEANFQDWIACNDDCKPLEKEVTDCMTLMETKYREKLNSWRTKPLRTTEKPSASAKIPSIVNDRCEKKLMTEGDIYSAIGCEEAEMKFELEWINEQMSGEMSGVDNFSLSEIFSKTWSWVTSHFLEVLYYFRPEREDGYTSSVEYSPTTSQHHYAPRIQRADGNVPEDSLRSRQTPMRMIRQHP